MQVVLTWFDGTKWTRTLQGRSIKSKILVRVCIIEFVGRMSCVHGKSQAIILVTD